MIENTKYRNYAFDDRFFEGEGGDAGAGEGEPAPAPAPAPKGGKPKFDEAQQQYVNTLLAKEKKSLRTQIETLQNKAKDFDLTAEAKAQLEQELESTRQQFLTEKEQLEIKAKKDATVLSKQVNDLSSERDTWRTRYTTETIARSLTDAALKSDAFNPAQVVDMLSTRTSLTDEIGEDGKKTGRLLPKVKIALPNAKGETVEMVLNPDDAVKQMKETPLHANLFKGSGFGGLGLSNVNTNTSIDPNKVGRDPAAYRKARKEGKIV
jgi:hypothetical protein